MLLPQSKTWRRERRKFSRWHPGNDGRAPVQAFEGVTQLVKLVPCSASKAFFSFWHVGCLAKMVGFLKPSCVHLLAQWAPVWTLGIKAMEDISWFLGGFFVRIMAWKAIGCYRIDMACYLRRAHQKSTNEFTRYSVVLALPGKMQSITETRAFLLAHPILPFVVWLPGLPDRGKNQGYSLPGGW